MKKTISTLAAALLMIALAGCSTSADEPGIATLDGSGSSAEAQTPEVEEGPRLRLDLTQAEIDAIYEAYDSCFEEHAVSKEDTAAADAACAHLAPRPPWEVDRNNPDALDFMTEVVACLKDKGVTYVEIDNDPTSPSIGLTFGGEQNDQKSITLGLEHTPTCEREVAAAKD